MNQIKTKFKRILKQHLAKSALMNVDFICDYNNNLLLCGWMAHREKSVGDVLNVESSNGDSSIDVFCFDRSDVQRHMQIATSDQVKGFIAVIPNRQSSDDIKIGHNGELFELAKQRFDKVSNPNQIIAHAGEYKKNAQSYIDSHIVVNWDDKSVSKVVKKLDPDVEKIKASLSTVNVHEHDFVQQCELDIIPEVHKIWKKRQNKTNNAQELVFGVLENTPKVSLIVPLYGRYDFMQHQLAHFANDNDFNDAELIFVLDDPKLKHEVKVTAHGLYQTFKHPFKLILSEHNLGFAGANNLGAEYASAEMLLLLNSDIIPKKSGWLSHYLSQFDTLDKPGVLGATLIYEDETVQHAGMTLTQDSSYPGLYMNHHPYKGVPLSLCKLPEISPTITTTGACMLMKKALFDEVDGFDVMYVLGDFEDSDLCLKFIDRGFNNYVSSSVVLYHLERLSQDLVDSGDWKFKLTMMNGAYQMTKWKSLIEEVTA